MCRLSPNPAKLDRGLSNRVTMYDVEQLNERHVFRTKWPGEDNIALVSLLTWCVY